MTDTPKTNFADESDEAILARAAVLGLPTNAPFGSEILRGYRRLAEMSQRLEEVDLTATPAFIFDPTR